MRITEKEQEIRKKSMICAAYGLFCQNGIDSTSIAQVAKTAGVSPNSIFRYFDSKASLVQATQIILWEEIVTQILTGSDEQLVNAKNGFEEIKILLSNFKKLYEDHDEFLLFASDYKQFLVRNHIKLTVQFYNQMMNPIYSIFTAALVRGQKDGSIVKRQTVSDQFSVIWSLMRGFVEEIIIYDRIYEGENPWKNQFESVLLYLLEALEMKA